MTTCITDGPVKGYIEKQSEAWTWKGSRSYWM